MNFLLLGLAEYQTIITNLELHTPISYTAHPCVTIVNYKICKFSSTLSAEQCVFGGNISLYFHALKESYFDIKDVAMVQSN